MCNAQSNTLHRTGDIIYQSSFSFYYIWSYYTVFEFALFLCVWDLVDLHIVTITTYKLGFLGYCDCILEQWEFVAHDAD